jgi:hypothetical protein
LAEEDNMAEIIRALDATDTTQILVSLQTWINSLQDPSTNEPIIPQRVYLEFVEGDLGYCIKSEGGAVFEEDITGDFSAEVPFQLYLTTNAVPDSAGEIFKPLNDLAAWFRVNGTTGLNIGARRTPDAISTLRGPTDVAGKDEKGNTTFVSIFSLTYDEEGKHA